MISDKRLEELLRDVHEVEDIDRARGVRGSIMPAWVWGVAAALFLGFITWIGIRANTRAEHSAEPRIVQAPPQAAEKRGSVVMAVAEDGEGKLKCVKWSADALGGKALDEVGANDLARAGLALQCDAAPARMLVVGLQGPVARLPDSDKRAMEIAECILRTPSCGAGSFDAKFCAQAGCAGSDIHVRVEPIALK
jgi:hypothetical protein